MSSGHTTIKFDNGCQIDVYRQLWEIEVDASTAVTLVSRAEYWLQPPFSASIELTQAEAQAVLELFLPKP